MNFRESLSPPRRRRRRLRRLGGQRRGNSSGRCAMSPSTWPRRGRRHHRPQRRGQEHAPQDPVPHHAADARPRRSRRPRGEPAGSRHRLSSGADRPREHLPQRRDPRHAAVGDPAQVRRDCRLRRAREVHRHAGQALLERDVRAPGVFGRGAPRSGNPDHRRGAGGRRAAFPQRCLGRMRESATRAGPCCSSATT